MFYLMFELIFDSYAETHFHFAYSSITLLLPPHLPDLESDKPWGISVVWHKGFFSEHSWCNGNIHSSVQLESRNQPFLLTFIYFLPTNKKQTRTSSPSFFNKGLHPRHCFKPQGVKGTSRGKNISVPEIPCRAQHCCNCNMQFLH